MNPLQLSQQKRNTAAAGRNIDAGFYYVTDPSPNDVLLGRGSNLVRYQGNIDFRRLIQSKKDDYTHAVQTGRNKDEIAQEIFNMTISNNGRFLRKVTDQEERRKLNLPTNIPVTAAIWVPVSKKVALEKVKQAFRDSHKHFDPSIDNIDDTKPSALGETSATATAAIAGTAINPSKQTSTHAITSSSDKSRQQSIQPSPTSTDAEHSLQSLVAQTLQRYQQDQMQKQQSHQKAESGLHGAAVTVPLAHKIASDTGINPSVAGTNPNWNRPIESTVEQLSAETDTQNRINLLPPPLTQMAASLNTNDSLDRHNSRTLVDNQNVIPVQPEYIGNLSSNATILQQLHGINQVLQPQQQQQRGLNPLPDLNQAVQYLNTSSEMPRHHPTPTLPSVSSSDNITLINLLLDMYNNSPLQLQQQQSPPTLESLTRSENTILLRHLLSGQSPLSSFDQQSLLSNLQSLRGGNILLQRRLSSDRNSSLQQQFSPSLRQYTANSGTMALQQLLSSDRRDQIASLFLTQSHNQQQEGSVSRSFIDILTSTTAEVPTATNQTTNSTSRNQSTLTARFVSTSQSNDTTNTGEDDVKKSSGKPQL